MSAFAVITAIAVNVVVVVGGVLAFARWFKRWVRDDVAGPIRRELNPPNDPGSTHEYARSAAEMSATTVQRLDELAGSQRENRAFAIEAVKLASDAHRAATAAHRRIDDHLRKDHL